MKKMRSSVIGLLILACLGLLAWAQGSTWQIDSNHSRAGFTIRHMGISNVKGDFDKVSGQVVLDDKDVTRSSVEVMIDAASIDTGVAARDGDLRGANYFDVARYPTITFKSKSVRKFGDKLKVVGDLTMHGATRPVTLDVEGPSAPMTDPRGNRHRGISATTTLNRHDFGINGGGAMVGADVHISIDAEMLLPAAK